MIGRRLRRLWDRLYGRVPDRIVGRLGGSFFRRRRARELDEEIRTHLRMAVEERMGRGATREEAERAARREFGRVDQVKEATRRVRGGMWIDRLLRDLSFAGRQLRRSPGFAAIALTTIAVSIGLTTSVFSLVNALLFRPLPGIEDPGRLVSLHTDEGDGPGVSVMSASIPSAMSPRSVWPICSAASRVILRIAVCRSSTPSSRT